MPWPEDLAPVRAVTTVPHEWTPGDGPSLVQVAIDNATHQTAWGGTSLHQVVLVRVTTWPRAEPGTAYGAPTTAKRLARLAEVALVTFPARPTSGVVATTDATSSTPIATFTVTVGIAPQM